MEVEDTALTLLPSTEDINEVEELDWPHMFDYRDRLARALYRQQGWRYPLEEYLSAGNLGMAEGLATFQSSFGYPLLAHIKVVMKKRMLQVRISEAGHGNIPDRNKGVSLARYQTVSGVPVHMIEQSLALLHPSLAHRGYLRRYLQELFIYIADRYGEDDLRLFFSWLMGESWEDIEREWKIPLNTLTVRVSRLRKQVIFYDRLG
jgi:hypothetical protein